MPSTQIASAARTVLVVDDERYVREVVAATLRRLGHEPLRAGSPAESRLLASSHGGPIHLLIVDAHLPGCTAEELARLAGIIPYEVLVGLNERIPREYRAV